MREPPKQFVGGRRNPAPAPYNNGAMPIYQNNGQPPQYQPPQRKRKKKWSKIILSLFLVLALVVGGIAGGFYLYLKNGLLDESKIQPVDPVFAPPGEWKGKVVNILIVGLDNDETRDYQDGDGLTDMLLLVHWDLTTNKMSMLQVPRDTQVATGQKINSVLRLGPNREAPINNILAIFNEEYKLPVDRYVTMDMDSLKELVDALGGLSVYVPKTLDYAGSRLEQGLHLLDGQQVEFFVRCRNGPGMARADIDRLENQRFFYSALFKRILDMSFKDIQCLMPVINKYFVTNFSVTELISLTTKALNLESENILFCRAPGASPNESWNPTGNLGNFILDLYGRGTNEDPGFASILNQYFRTFDQRSPISAYDLGAPQIEIPSYISLYPTNIQSMGQVEDSEAAA